MRKTSLNSQRRASAPDQRPVSFSTQSGSGPNGRERTEEAPLGIGYSSQTTADVALNNSVYTVDELARKLRCSAKTVRRRIKDGIIRKAKTEGRLVRIAATEVRRLLAEEDGETSVGY